MVKSIHHIRNNVKIEKWTLCNSTCTNLFSISEPTRNMIFTHEGLKTKFVQTIYYKFTYTVPLFESFLSKRHNKRKRESIHHPGSNIDVQILQVGDLVRVRSEAEIKATLDESGRLKGLGFMREMTRCCGKEFRVLKIVQNIMLESTGELRRIKTPTYLLEGAYCDGEYHNHCDRSCFYLWRGEWLTKI
jgi:hypothetical protein